MSSDWSSYKLSSLATFKYGKFLAKSALNSTGYPVFSGYGVVGYLPDYQFQDPQLLIVCRGEGGTGDVKMSPPKCSVTNLSIVISPDDRQVSRKFLFWALKASDTHILRTGSAQAQIVIGSLENFSVLIPDDRNRQDAISSLLDGLDDRITLLRETNATLEAIAQALFKSWFVDFDPVRAKQAGLAPEGMDEATAALFPDAFEESALGLVPKGWQTKPLDKVADYLNGLALQKFPPQDNAWMPVIKIAQLRKGDTIGADRAGRNIKPEYIIQNGDVLFSWSGSLEVEIWCGGEGALNQHLFKVTSKQYPKWFYFLWTRHHLETFRQIAASKATTMGHIQRAHLTQALVACPGAALVEQATAVFEPLMERWIANALQAQTFTNLRDTLLPRLISGQLRLPEAQHQIEEATA